MVFVNCKISEGKCILFQLYLNSFFPTQRIGAYYPFLFENRSLIFSQSIFSENVNFFQYKIRKKRVKGSRKGKKLNRKVQFLRGENYNDIKHNIKSFIYHLER